MKMNKINNNENNNNNEIDNTITSNVIGDENNIYSNSVVNNVN